MATLSQDVSLKTPTLTLTLNPSPDHGHALPGRAPHSRPPPTAHRPPPSHARLLPQTRADMGIGSLLWRRGLPLSPQDPQAFAYLGCGKRAPAPTSSAPVGLPRAGDHTQTQTYTRARALSLSLSTPVSPHTVYTVYIHPRTAYAALTSLLYTWICRLFFALGGSQAHTGQLPCGPACAGCALGSIAH